MYRLIVIVLILTGCAAQNSKPIAANDHSLLKGAIVVSTLGDDLHCSFVGLTVFNNKSKTYELDANFNQKLSSSMSDQLNSMGMNAAPLSRGDISFIDDDVRAKRWDNIQFGDFPKSSSNISSIVILDGKYQYNSTGGYYARDNALNTSATLYVYEFPTGRLIGKAFSQHSTLKKSFSCTQETVPDSDHMLDLIDESGQAILTEVFATLFGAQASHNE